MPERGATVHAASADGSLSEGLRNAALIRSAEQVTGGIKFTHADDSTTVIPVSGSGGSGGWVDNGDGSITLTAGPHVTDNGDGSITLL